MSRKKIFLLSGFPGSGKSTWSRDQVKHGAIIVDQDSIRRMIHSEYVFDEKKEPIVRDMSYACIDVALKNSDNIIIDETFLTAESRDGAICQVHKNTMNCDIYVLVFPETNKNLKYRMHDARGYSKDQWADVIEKLKEKYEVPDVTKEDINYLYKVPVDFEKRKSIVEL